MSERKRRRERSVLKKVYQMYLHIEVDIHRKRVEYIAIRFIKQIQFDDLMHWFVYTMAVWDSN